MAKKRILKKGKKLAGLKTLADLNKALCD